MKTARPAALVLAFLILICLVAPLIWPTQPMVTASPQVEVGTTTLQGEQIPMITITAKKPAVTQSRFAFEHRTWHTDGA